MEEANTRTRFKTVCVFCGSNSGYRQVFSDAAIDLGDELVGLVTNLLIDLGSYIVLPFRVSKAVKVLMAFLLVYDSFRGV